METRKIITIAEHTADRYAHSLKMDRDDIVQELSILLWRITLTKSDTLSKAGSAEGYLYRAAAHWCDDMINREHENGEWITDCLEDIESSSDSCFSRPRTVILRSGRQIVLDDHTIARREKAKEYNRQYYQRNREKMLERSNARNHRVRKGGGSYEQPN